MLKHLGEYKVMEKLGEGGMGSVYRGYQESLDREVALKVLSEKLCEDETYIARFQREARAAASLVHPNVIQVFSIGCEQDIHYFAMEYVRGKDIAAHIQDGREFTYIEIIDIMIQVMQAFCCAAEIGLIHRDIKPSNIMLDEKGVVKITDFGLAKTTDSNLTEVGSIVGTANYMSPEQSQGMILDYRTDFYSLGVVFYEMIVGAPPFSAEQPAAVLFKHVYEAPPVPSTINSDIPPVFDRVILHLLEKQPEDRPCSGEEYLAELRKLYDLVAPSSVARHASAFEIKKTNKEVKVDARLSSEIEPTIIVKKNIKSNYKKALIVDDIASVRKLFSSILKEKNFSVSEAEDGAVALKKCIEEKPDLIFLDLAIPKVDGFELLQEFADRRISAKIIVLTGKKDTETLNRVTEYKIEAFLAKPVNIHELRDKIDEVMENDNSPIKLSAKQNTSNKTKKNSIVIYDALPYSQHLLRQVLQSENHNVVGVAERDEALDILKEGLPDLVVLSAERDSRDAVAFAQEIRKNGWNVPIISIIDELDTTAKIQLKEVNAEPILTRPIRLDNFKLEVAKCLEDNIGKLSNIKPSGVFDTLVHKQIIKDTAFNIFDFAKTLIPVVPDSLRKKYEKTILEKPRNAVCNTIAGIIKQYSASHGSREAMRYVRNAYRKGDFSTRNLCLILLKEILDKEEELEVLSKIITDEDFRIRIRVLNRIGEMNGASLAPLVVRFLNDDVWKVRNAAIDTINDIGVLAAFDSLVKFYANSRLDIPDKIRKLMADGKDQTKIHKIDDLAHDKNPATRVFVARLIGDIHSKQLITTMIDLLKDKHPAVRAEAARSIGRIKSDVTLRELFRAITDSNSSVQEAVIKSLRTFEMTKGARALLEALAGRKKKIADSAAKLLLQLNSNESHLDSILTNLEKQSTESRKYLSLLLRHLIKDENKLKSIVVDLNSKEGEKRKKAAGVVRLTINN